MEKIRALEKKKKEKCRRAEAVQRGSLRKVTQHRTGADNVDGGGGGKEGVGHKYVDYYETPPHPQLSSVPPTPALP